MEPALTLAIMCAGVLGASLVLDLSGSAVVALLRIGPATHWSVTPRMARLVVAVFVVSALLRMGQVGAATPPPMHRIERSGASDASDAVAPAPTGVSLRTLGPDASTHVVATGECLWRIARSHLDAAGLPASGAEVSRLWRAIYAQNRDVIGDNPDLILPGQVLTIPGDLHGT